MSTSALVATSRKLATRVDRLTFEPPTTHVYNPLVYARAPHEAYLKRYGEGRRRVLLLGMNPGPFGMAQTGVPFGDVKMVSDFLGIRGAVSRPEREHPARPVLGFECPRSEVSGSRLWGWARDRFGSADAFFERFFVVNYCPLVFIEATGKNRTPDKLAASEQRPLLEACDAALREWVAILEPRRVIGVGAFAEASAQRALAGSGVEIGCILHPSPANPKANSGWSRIVEEQLERLGIRL
jgi:single-strand selective monofunctional uracil DNA glycosylase